ncbi:MAG: hypothetical protein R3F20_09995 [Planctomycetota bacterium]
MSQRRRDVVIRAGSFVLGVLLLFTAFMRVIYLECAAVASAYEIRKLREDEARLRNANDVLRADIEPLRNVSLLHRQAGESGFVEVPSDAVQRVVIERGPEAEQGDAAD